MLVAEPKTYLSATRAAELCGISRNRLMKLIDKSLVRASFSRITDCWQVDMASLRDYLTRRGHRLPEAGREAMSLVVVGTTPAFFADLVEHLPGDVRASFAAGSFDAGRLVAQERPELAVIDFRASRSDAVDLGVRLSKARIRCVGLALEDETDARGLLRAGFAQVLKRPVTAAAVRDAVTSIME